ncbi:MAG: hypothetical protein II576_09980, partial [Prevotella sp.]|nr:hypothetical protein [Prevotella sp.]
MKRIIYLIVFFLVLVSCQHTVKDAVVVKDYPKIYPDYIGVTIPVNIAPLNFNYVGGDLARMDVVIKGSKGGELHVQGEEASFDIDEWHELVAQNKGGQLNVTVCVEIDGKWTQYIDFPIYVSNYPIDEWGLTYRRIAPGYEVYSSMGLYQRDLSNFDEYAIIENTHVPGMCVNCHTAQQTDPSRFVFHVRGNHGATM